MKLILFPIAFAAQVQVLDFPRFQALLHTDRGQLQAQSDWLIFFYQPTEQNRKRLDDFEALAKQIKTEGINYGSVSCRKSMEFCQLMEAYEYGPHYLLVKGSRVYRLGAQTGLSTEVYVQIEKDHYHSLDYTNIENFGILQHEHKDDNRSFWEHLESQILTFFGKLER